MTASNIPDTLDMARGLLEESMHRPAIRVVNDPEQTALTQAEEAFHRAYARTYTAGSRVALDEADHRQAHDEAITEGVHAAVAVYAREMRLADLDRLIGGTL